MKTMEPETHAIGICDQLVMFCMGRQTALLERWSDATNQLSRIFPDFLQIKMDLQQLSRLDSVVSQLEGDMAILLAKPGMKHPFIAEEFCFTLARSWLSLSYELLRTLRQRLRSQAELEARWRGSLQEAYTEIERVRMLEFKREIADGDFKLAKGRPIEMFRFGDTAPPVPYEHKTSLISCPVSVRESDGSIVWHPFDARLGSSKAVFRRELSQAIVTGLERL